MNQNPAGNSTLTIAPGRVPDGLLMIWTTSEFGCWKRILSQHALHHGLLECLTGLSVEHVTALLAHEMAHIRRHDYLTSILQSIAEAVLFYHPAVWWISAQIRAEREMCRS